MKRFTSFLFALLLTALPSQAANIVWVSFHSADDMPSSPAAAAGYAEAPDAGYTRLLEDNGHIVTRYITTATPDVEFLNTFDLVIISRSVNSGNYQTAESRALWHSITAPKIIMTGYNLRANRMGFTTGDTMPDTTGLVHLRVNDPSHPIFAGVELDGENDMVSPYADVLTIDGTLQRGISVNDNPVAGGGMVLAVIAPGSDGPEGGMMIAEWPTGAVMNTGDLLGGPRLVFLSGSREAAGITGDTAGIFDLEPDGAHLFLNAVQYMGGDPLAEPPPRFQNFRPAFGTSLYYAPFGLNFQVTTVNPEGIPEANISVVLNGADISAALEISGPPQQRTVSYDGLVFDTDYTAVITARDANGVENATTLTFNTRRPVALSPDWAFPVSAAVASAPGMRARVVQSHDEGPNLANTAQRAEAQLAGTLIDPATGLPYDDWTSPSEDNPDGSYNQNYINWNVDAEGLGPEQGNFRAPDFPDEWVPGLVWHNLNIAAEVLTYLELSPGRHVMGVNSDDGFVVYAGVDYRDILAVDLGRFDGGRGSADTIFQFEVEEAGLYPFRLVWYQGGGEANLEWFTVDLETNEKVLVNYRANPLAVRAWREVTVPSRPYVSGTAPAPGQGNVPADTTISITLQDGGAQVQESSVQLSLDGQPVAAQVSKAGGVTTVSYTPAQRLQGETAYAASLFYSDSAGSERTAHYSFTTQFVPPVTAEGANIVWVSVHEADGTAAAAAASAGFTEAPDAGYTRLLEASGHTVTRYVTTPSPDPAFLNTFDLVIISRSVPSGDYEQPESTASWHAITAPMMHLGGYAIRANRLGFTTGDDIPDTSGTVRLTVHEPSHPIFTGITLGANNIMVNPYATDVTWNGTLQRGISVNNNPPAGGGTLLASVASGSGAGGMIIGEFAPGTAMGNATEDTTAGRRLVFLTGSREASGLTSQGAGIFDLAGDGAQLLLNAVAYMTGAAIEPSTVNLGIARSANNMTLSWPASGTDGFLLEVTGSLSAPDWQPVTAEPVDSGGERSVTVTAAESSRFYRLRRP